MLSFFIISFTDYNWISLNIENHTLTFINKDIHMDKTEHKTSYLPHASGRNLNLTPMQCVCKAITTFERFFFFRKKGPNHPCIAQSIICIFTLSTAVLFLPLQSKTTNTITSDEGEDNTRPPESTYQMLL